MSLSLKEIYGKKHILILGGLGFMGKVLLAMLMDRLPEIGQIYLVIRNKKGMSAQSRFQDTLENSPVFANISKQLLTQITIIEGDAGLPDFGMSEDLANRLKEKIDLVINSSGLVDFNPDLREAITGNLQSVQNAGNFVIESKKASLLHISTCYVAGNQNNTIDEELKGTVSPNEKPFDILEELQITSELIREATVQYEDPKQLKNHLVREGQKRALYWGWPNIYTYTKSMGESWLELNKDKLRFAIVRPAIVESSVDFPFPGWVQGFNTMAPLAYLAGEWYPFIAAKKNHPIDFIPVDILTCQIIKIGAAILSNSHREVYQCASSHRNPLYLDFLMATSRNWHRKVATSFKERVKLFLNARALTLDHPLSVKTLYQLINRIPPKLMKRFRFLSKLRKKIYFICKIQETYLPFIYHNSTIFISQNINEIKASETEFEKNVDQINWGDYLMNVQMPGLDRWCFSELSKN